MSSLGEIVEYSTRLKSRKDRLALARSRNNREIRSMLGGPMPRGDAAQDGYDMAFSEVMDDADKISRGEFPDRGDYDDLVPDGDYVCEECVSGHIPGCDSLFLEDLEGGYLMDRCLGCCPNECPEYGMEHKAKKAGIIGGLIRRLLCEG